MIPWDEVSLDEGTGIVHIAPGCGLARTSSSRACTTCRCSTPVDEAGRFYDDTAGFAGLSTVEAAEQIIGNLERARHPRRGRHEHRYPICWRCHTPLIFRIADDWFISARELRQPMLDANATVEWTPRVHGQAHGRLAAQHGRLEHLAQPLLRAAAAVLSVRVRPPERDRVARGARGARRRGPRPARGAAPAVDRPRAASAARQCGEPVERIKEVGDVWLDAGIVPFSTLGWQNPEWIERATRRAPRAG